MDEKTRGIVLRTRPLSDTSLIVDWLTETCGRLKTVAKGAQRPKSPFRSRLDLYHLADLSFRRSRHSSLHILKEVTLESPRLAIPRRLPPLEHAAYATSLIEQVTEAETPLPECFNLLLGYLKHLSQSTAQPADIAAFEIKLLDELGVLHPLDPTDLPETARRWIHAVRNGTWPEPGGTLATPPPLSPITSFLGTCLTHQLGRVPSRRAKALNATSR